MNKNFLILWIFTFIIVSCGFKGPLYLHAPNKPSKIQIK
ncbi:lipoprotein [Candidatus Profftia lariciata]|nr:lipoprotein [Candidatus Profftia lariciata]